MISSAYLRFTGYQDFVLERKTLPVGYKQRRPASVDTVTLSNSYRKGINIGGCEAGDAEEIIFADNSKAYIKYPYIKQNKPMTSYCGISATDFPLRERGAYLLSQMLGLTIVPQTELLNLQETQGYLNCRYGLKTASIQEHVSGVSLNRQDSAEYRQFQNMMSHLPSLDTSLGQSLIELYIYMVVVFDSDKADRNLIFNRSTKRLWSIDNECSGTEPLKCNHAPPRLTDELPSIIQDFYQGQDIPQAYIKSLIEFIYQRPRLEKQLHRLYPPQVVKEMFHRALLILYNQKLLPLFQMDQQLMPSPSPNFIELTGYAV